MENEKKSVNSKAKSTVKKSSTAKKSAAKKTTSSAKKGTSKSGVKKVTTTKKTTTGKKSTPTKKKVLEEKKVVLEPTTTINNEVKEEKIVVETKDSKINYPVLIGIVVAFILIAISLANTMTKHNMKNITKSYLITNKIVTNELTNGNINEAISKERSFVFITSLNNNKEYVLEKNLAKIIEKNKLADDFYVFNSNKNTDVNINNEFRLNGRNLKVPTILYYKNGELIDVVEREDNSIITEADFEKLLDMYELK